MSLLRCVLVLAALLTSACAISPAPTLLVLERPTYTGPVTSPKLPIIIGPVTLPEAIDRTHVMHLVDSHRMEALPATRWAQPLRSEIASTLAAHLAQALDNPRIQPMGISLSSAPHQRLSVDILRIDLRIGGEVTIEALWALSADPGGRELASRRISLSEKLNGTGGEAIAAAHSRAVARLATEIAATVRALPP